MKSVIYTSQDNQGAPSRETGLYLGNMCMNNLYMPKREPNNEPQWDNNLSLGNIVR